MNLKRITALTLALGISVNGSMSSVLAAGPAPTTDSTIKSQDLKSDSTGGLQPISFSLKSRVIPTPTIETQNSANMSTERFPVASPLTIESQTDGTPTIGTEAHSTPPCVEEESKELAPSPMIDRSQLGPTSEKIESLFKEFLKDDKILENEENYTAKLIINDLLENFAEKQSIDNLHSQYKNVLDNYCKTDFYTVENEEDNLEHKLKSIDEQIDKIDESVAQLSEKLDTCEKGLDTNSYKKATDKESAAFNFGYNFSQIRKIIIPLNENKKGLIELEKNYKILINDIVDKYETISSKDSKKSDTIYSNITKIIKTQIEKYNLQITYLSKRIEKTKKTIECVNKHILKLNKQKGSFLRDDPLIMSVYTLKNENELLKWHITSMQKIHKNEKLAATKQTQQEVATPRVKSSEADDYLSNNISPISKPLYDPSTKNVDLTSTNIDTTLIDKEIRTIFTDEAFAKYVYTYILCNDESGYVDSYKLTYLDAYTIQKVSQISFTIFEQDINSLEGIQYFANLRYLCCPKKNICNIDLTKNKELEYLDISENKLKDSNLDLSENSNLKEFDCKGCGIEKITLPGSDSMVKMDLSNNNIKDILDLSSFTNLLEINLANNDLTGLIVSDSNIITNLNIANNKNLGELDVNQFKNLIELDCSSTNRKELKITELKKLEKLLFQQNEGVKADISACTNLKYLTCCMCKLNGLDLSNLTSLESFDCSNNDIETLNVPSENLKKAIYHSNPLTEITVAKNAFCNGLDYDDRFTGKNKDGNADIFCED